MSVQLCAGLRVRDFAVVLVWYGASCARTRELRHDRLTVAALDQLKVASRATDRGSPSQPRRVRDPVGGMAARVLALQSTLGNRATTEVLRARPPAPRLLQRSLRGKKGVLSARNGKLDGKRGREILEQFARNDPRSVTDLVGDVGTIKALDAQEWGLIYEKANEEVHLILGTVTGVQWAEYLGEGTPLAHSHPWRKEQELKKELTIGEMLATASYTIEEMVNFSKTDPAWGARRKVLPTISDFVMPATQEQKEHTVFTPYVIDEKGVVHNPDPDLTPTLPQAGVVPAWTQPAPRREFHRLVWKLTEICLDTSNNQVTGRLTAMRGRVKVWTHRVRAPVLPETPPPPVTPEERLVTQEDWDRRRSIILQSTDYTLIH